MGESTSLVDRNFLAGLYRSMVQMRAVEGALLQLSQKGTLNGSLHLATGQEALPAGACAALRTTDAITVTYRGHGYVLAKGCDLHDVLAEILGKASGLCGGRGGKMHLTDLPNGLLGANGIVAGGIGTAAGAALAAWIDGTDDVAAAVFGDGALNQGHAHEVMNMAGLWKLPIIFLCENNLYAEMTPLSRSTAEIHLTAKMAAYGIPAYEVDGNDVLAVYEAMSKAVAQARSGGGPTFLEAHTYRTCGHYQNDPGTAYRTKEEVENWEQRSPSARFETTLMRDHGFTAEELAQIGQDEFDRVQGTVKQVLLEPDPNPLDLMESVYA